jgi:hypothetical protein
MKKCWLAAVATIRRKRQAPSVNGARNKNRASAEIAASRMGLKLVLDRAGI